MAFCVQCGKELTSGLRFCPECGAPVEESDPAELAESAVEAPVAEAPAAGADAVQAVESAVEAVKTIAGTIGQAIDAPAAAGETVLSSWQGAGAGVPTSAMSIATQAIGAAVGQVQKAVQETHPMPEVQPDRPAQPLQAAQEMPAQTAQSTPMTQTEQFKSHAPANRYASSGGGAKPAAEKKKSKLPLIVIAAGAVVLVAAFALYVVPRFVFHPVDPNEHTALVSNSSASASASA